MMTPINIEESLQALKRDFIDGLGERISQIESLIINNDPENQQELFRLVHSLKGTAGTYGMLVITSICHQIEEIIRLLQDNKIGPAEFQERTLPQVDLIRQVADEARAGATDFDHIKIRLATIKKSVQPTGNSLNILIVEPSESLLELQKSLFSEDQVNLIIKKDGLSALSAAINDKIDCLVTSYEIPELNGLALIAAIKYQKKNNSPVTVLISSRPTEYFDNIPDHVISRDNRLGESIRQVISVLHTRLLRP